MHAKRPLKVWHLMDSYPPDYGGGATLAARAMCHGLAERGHEVRVICTRKAEGAPLSVDTDYDGPIRVDRVNATYFWEGDPEGWRLGLSGWRDHERRVGELLRQFLADDTPDLVHYHVLRPFGEQCLLEFGRHRIPIVATAHDAWLICPRLYLLKSPESQPCSGPGKLKCLACQYSAYDGSGAKALVKLPWRLLKQGVLPAYRLRRRAKARRHLAGVMSCARWLETAHTGHTSGTITSIPLGIDLSRLPTSFPPRPRTPVRFGFFAGFQPHKGIDHVLGACAGLHQQGLPFELHIWGPIGDEERKAVQRRVADQPIHLHGLYQPSAKWQVFGQVDIAIMATTVVEPFGLVIQEARAAGIPTIAPDVGGPSEQIEHGKTGLLYRFRDQGDLQAQMQRVLEEPDLLRRLIADQPEPQDARDAVELIERFYYARFFESENHRSRNSSIR